MKIVCESCHNLMEGDPADEDTEYQVCADCENPPKLISKILDELDQKREKVYRAMRIAKILESITVSEELSAYPKIYDSWLGYHGRIQINGFTNLKAQFPPIMAQFAKAGYKVKKFDDNAQQGTRTYYLCLREDENVQDIYVQACLDSFKAQCRYVQVGTRVKEEPVYELRCDDPIVESDPDPFTGDAVESDMPSGEQRESEGVSQDGEVSGDSTDSANLPEGLQQDLSPERAESAVDDGGQVGCGEE